MSRNGRTIWLNQDEAMLLKELVDALPELASNHPNYEETEKFRAGMQRKLNGVIDGPTAAFRPASAAVTGA